MLDETHMKSAVMAHTAQDNSRIRNINASVRIFTNLFFLEKIPENANFFQFWFTLEVGIFYLFKYYLTFIYVTSLVKKRKS